MDFTFTSSHLNPFLYFGSVFVVAFLISGTLSFVLGTIAFQSEAISIIREDLKSFIGVTLLCAIVMTALSGIFYSDINAAITITAARADITSGIENAYGVELGDNQYRITFENSASSLSTVADGGVIETDSFSDGDNIYKFRVTDSKIILLEKAVTSGGDGFVESEHVK